METTGRQQFMFQLLFTLVSLTAYVNGDFQLQHCSTVNASEPLSQAPNHEPLLIPMASQDIPSSMQIRITRTPLTNQPGDRRCNHDNLRTVPSSEINARSTCPWHYVLNTDMNRIPTSIVEAKCNCDGSCIGAAGNTRCMPIRYYIRVQRIHTHCVNDNEELEPVFRTVSEPVIVGCSCGIRAGHHHHHGNHNRQR